MRLDQSRIKDLAKIVKRLDYKPISFNDPNLFPECDDFIYPNYVFFLIAIDHRTGFKNTVTCGSKKYHGSDLIFYLARKKQKKHTDFFTAKNLIEIDSKTIKNIFRIGEETIKNPEQRALLLRDCAKKLMKFDGDIMNLLGDHYLANGGILDKLKIFKAYEDPLQKKSYLFIKILKRQGMAIKDPYNLRFPIDSVLVRVALSSGIVKIEEELKRKIEYGLTPKETLELREVVSQAFNLLSKYSKIHPDILDDVLWYYGRELWNENIKTLIDDRVNKKALDDLIYFLRYEKIDKIKFPETWYF